MKFTTVKIKYQYIYSIIIVALFLIILFILVPNEFKYRSFITCILILIIIGLNILGNKTYKLITTGEIKFEEELILVNDINNQLLKNIRYEEVEKITLWYIAFKGELAGGGKSFALSKGGNNEIKIKTKEKIYKYNIYLDSETDAIRLRMLYRFLKENNVKVKLKEP